MRDEKLLVLGIGKVVGFTYERKVEREGVGETKLVDKTGLHPCDTKNWNWSISALIFSLPSRKTKKREENQGMSKSTKERDALQKKEAFLGT